MRIVVKVGSSTLAHATGQMNIRRVEALDAVVGFAGGTGGQGDGGSVAGHRQRAGLGSNGVVRGIRL